MEDVSFTARQGEVTALIGPSGGGKSTACKLAARFWDVTGGKVSLGGTDVSTVDPETLLRSYLYGVPGCGAVPGHGDGEHPLGLPGCY